VASPIAIGNPPEASGSSVPAWPARLGGRHADRLVEDDPAMDVAFVAARLVVLLRLPLARIVVAALDVALSL
jgi:hypothetical protein